MDKKGKLVDIFGRGNVLVDEDTLNAYAKDESFALPIRPSFVVKAADVNQVRALVLWANETSTPVVPVSSGPPHFRGDTVPGAPDAVVVDLSGMKKIVRIDRRTRMALIESGVTYGEFQTELAKHGLHAAMPLLPRPTKSVVASLLEREPTTLPRFQWAAHDPLRCMEVVFGDGNYMTTGEAGGLGGLEREWSMHFAQHNPAGPAQTGFNKILSAAQGSMGVVTWASIKCQLIPEVQKLYSAGVHRLDDLIDFAYRVLRFRFADEFFFLNNVNLASILAETPEDIQALAGSLPGWTLVMGVAGRDTLSQLKVDNHSRDIKEFAQQAGLTLTNSVPGASEPEFLDMLSQPSAEPYWKLRAKGASEDIFFISTLDRAPEFIRVMTAVCEDRGYPLGEMGVYLQPVHQGASCHVEFNLPYDRDSAREVSMIRALARTAAEELIRQGAFFSRPYGAWAGMVFNRDAQSMNALRKIKNIFDPNHVMNPSRLCF